MRMTYTPKRLLRRLLEQVHLVLPTPRDEPAPHLCTSASPPKYGVIHRIT
jgi:hypothetical protein